MSYTGFLTLLDFSVLCVCCTDTKTRMYTQTYTQTHMHIQRHTEIHMCTTYRETEAYVTGIDTFGHTETHKHTPRFNWFYHRALVPQTWIS